MSASNGATPVYFLTATSTINTAGYHLTAADCGFLTPSVATSGMPYVGAGNTPIYVGATTSNGVYQTGPLVIDDEEQRVAWEAIKELADRARQEQIEAETELYERLESLRDQLLGVQGLD